MTAQNEEKMREVAEKAFDDYANTFNTESNEWLDMGADDMFVAGYQAALAKGEQERKQLQDTIDFQVEQWNAQAKVNKQLQQRIAELENNERAYERIIGKKTYQEIADELAESQKRETDLQESITSLNRQLDYEVKYRIALTSKIEELREERDGYKAGEAVAPIKAERDRLQSENEALKRERAMLVDALREIGDGSKMEKHYLTGELVLAVIEPDRWPYNIVKKALSVTSEQATQWLNAKMAEVEESAIAKLWNGGKVRYMKPNSFNWTDAQQAAFSAMADECRTSGLYEKGDAILVWVNEGDIVANGELIAASKRNEQMTE
jgi:hypothetical protein